MKYNFDETGDHRQDGSIRWEQPKGRDDIIGMGTADMDLNCAFPVPRVYGKYCSQSARRIHIITDSSRRVIFSL